jgi:RND family efflux transporter MFP subunit
MLCGFLRHLNNRERTAMVSKITTQSDSSDRAIFWRSSSKSLLLLFLLLSSTALVASAQEAPPPPVVSVANPVFKQVTEWDEFTGRFVAQQRVEVRARVSGYLESVHFVEGQIVEAGQLLFIVDQRPFLAETEGARAEVQSAATGLKRAQLEFERGKRLQSARAMSKETIEERGATRDAAQAMVAAATAKLRTAELDLGFTEVRAPLTGRSSDIKVDVGNLISGGAADSTILTTIVSLDPIELEFEGSEAEMLRYMRTSQVYRLPTSTDHANPVEARLIDETEWLHKGFVSFLDNQLDFDTGTIRARATFTNKDLLFLPGMFARMRMFAQEKHDAVLIPDSAVVADQARKMVMVVDANDTIEARVVSLGPLVDGLRVVREGLQPHERIVVNGILRARPGAKVTPQAVEIADPGNTQ